MPKPTGSLPKVQSQKQANAPPSRDFEVSSQHSLSHVIDMARAKPIQVNSEQKLRSGIRENQSNFTFKGEDEPQLSSKAAISKPTISSIIEQEANIREEPATMDSFVPREHYDELSKMYRILQAELNKTFEALLEFKNFEEKYRSLENEYSAFKEAHQDCPDPSRTGASSPSQVMALERELEVVKEQNEMLKRKNKRHVADLQELNKTFERGITQLRSELSSSNQDLENENQRLRQENAELTIRCSTNSVLEMQLKKSLADLETEKKHLIQRVADSHMHLPEIKSDLTSISQRIPVGDPRQSKREQIQNRRTDQGECRGFRQAIKRGKRATIRRK